MPVRNGPLNNLVCVPHYLPSVHTLIYRGSGAIINNGVIGMANSSGTRTSSATRIPENSQSTAIAHYVTRINGVFANAAIKVHYNHRAFVAQFASDWSFDSPADVSYSSRIDHGSEFSQDQAL